MWRKIKGINPWIGFNDLPFILVGTPIVASLVTMIFFGLNVREAFSCTMLNILPASFSTLVFWIGDRYITIAFRKLFPAFQQTRRRLLYQSLAILAYTAGIALPLKLSEPFFDHSFVQNVEHPGYIKSFVACLFATIPISAIYEAGFFINRWKLSIAEAERLKQQNTQSQLEALRNQINPHFLFNSLNTLASLIPEDSATSVQFVQKLSKVYRIILDLGDKQVVTLQEELEFLNDYNYLMKTRFGDNIHFEVVCEDGCKSCYLVPLSLQILIENAIRHNIVSSKKPLHIRIEANQRFVRVSNNLQPRTQPNTGTGTGLKNIRERYQLTFGLPIEIDQTADAFIVQLPLVNIQAHEHSHR